MCIRVAAPEGGRLLLPLVSISKFNRPNQITITESLSFCPEALSKIIGVATLYLMPAKVVMLNRAGAAQYVMLNRAGAAQYRPFLTLFKPQRRLVHLNFVRRDVLVGGSPQNPHVSTGNRTQDLAFRDRSRRYYATIPARLQSWCTYCRSSWSHCCVF